MGDVPQSTAWDSDLAYAAKLHIEYITGADLTLTDATAITASGLITGNANLTIGNGATTAGVLTINEDTSDGTNNATFTIPALAADTDYTLPPDDGDAGEQLQTNGSGVLTWEVAGAGGGEATTVSDTATIDLTLTGVDVKGDVILLILNPVATDDYSVWCTPYAITIKHVHVQCLGGTNIVGQLTEHDGEGINPAVVDSTDITATANNSVDDDGTLSNPSIDALDYVGWATTSISGTPTSVTVTFDYTINQVN